MSAPVLYLVRVWQQPGQHGDAAFRASLRPLDSERETLFARPADLVNQLANCLAKRQAGPPGPPPDPAH
jgi:hypothetical protein